MVEDGKIELPSLTLETAQNLHVLRTLRTFGPACNLGQPVGHSFQSGDCVGTAALAVVAKGTSEHGPLVESLADDDRANNRGGANGVIGAAVLLTTQEHVAGDGSRDAREETTLLGEK